MSQEFKNHDMTMMFTIHAALRREVERIARITARVDEDPRHVLSTAVGWELFKKFLTIHHTAEDITVWPVMQKALADKPDELALLADMEAEHAVIDPLLADIDAALADRESGLERLGGLADALHTHLNTHLDHEEGDALKLMDITMSKEEWAVFAVAGRDAIGDDARRYLPWLLDGMPADQLAAFVSNMPDALRIPYENDWRPAYEELDIWHARSRSANR
ncbi:hemerythrin domain-containing protein [Streptomyces sp. NPDC001414]